MFAKYYVMTARGQCLKEAKYCGIRMDISLKEPTLLFGLNHYESRAHVFLGKDDYY